jgi:hypothetical protein
MTKWVVVAAEAGGCLWFGYAFVRGQQMGKDFESCIEAGLTPNMYRNMTEAEVQAVKTGCEREVDRYWNKR